MGTLSELVINGRFLTQPITGVQRYQHEILAALDVIAGERRDLSIELVTPQLSGPPPALRHIAVRQVGRLQGHGWEQLELPRAVKGRPLFCGGNMAPLASLYGAGPVVVTVHDLSYRYFPDAYSRAYRLFYEAVTPQVLHRADAIITVSKSEKRSIASLYPRMVPRLHAIQNGGLPIGGEAIDAPIREVASDYALYVGSLSKRKNFPNLVRAAVRLVQERNLSFVFVGGTGRSLEEAEVDIPDAVRDRLIFLGQVQDTARLIGLYRHARAFVFPSLYEASPLPPIEAMASGAPVISSDIPSLTERCGDAARYCKAEDPDSIVAAVTAVLDDPAERARLVAAGLERARRYDWLACARATLSVIERVP